MGGNNGRKINIRRSDSVATLRRLVGAEIAGAHNNDWRQRKQIARMLFRGDLLISVTVQGILMSANAQAKGLLAELMQCHPASELAGNCLQLAALVAVPQNEEERRTQQHPS